MANPYEEGMQSLTDEMQNIDPNAIIDSLSNAIQPTSDSNVEPSAEFNVPNDTSTEIALADTSQKNDYATRKQRNEAKKIWNRLPDGSEKDQLKDEWSMKYYGVPYREQFPDRSGLMYQNSSFYNQERMMAAPTGLVDWFTDLTNWGTQKIRHPLKIGEVPKIGKFEDDGAQAMREISSLVGPFFLLKGKAVTGAGAIHKSGVAAKYAPWLERLGNNKAFQHFAKIGLDQGVGAFVDVVGKTNQINDTLATSWKRGNWWGHNLIPESWTSDKLSPDAKHRANVLEGQRLGFFTNVAEVGVKLFKAARGVQNVNTQFLTEAGKKNKALENLVIDPLDSKVFDEADATTDSLLRSEAKYDRERSSLTKYFTDSNNLNVNKPTVGIHEFSDNAQEGLIPKAFDGIIGAAKD